MATQRANPPHSLLYALTILTSAFLIFQVQPLISKSILPWFGGTPGVWTTCMLFFQVVLFAGYAYAHASIRWLSSRQQALLHVVLLFAAILLLPVSPSETWKPQGDENPTVRILGLLTLTVGLPYFLLSSTGPLLQGWFSETRPGASPYRLYALSNIGSVLGLVTYPFVFEPWLSSEVQSAWWSVAFIGFAVVCSGCALDLAFRSRQPKATAVETQDQAVPPGWADFAKWFGLSACASVMLLATTNQVCLDVAVIPFLWVLPLTLYLASFILCFDRAWWYPRQTFAMALAGAMVCLTLIMELGSGASLVAQVAVYFVSLFFCCMVCHGELVRSRPSPRYLTTFYLASSAGGAVGGLLVGAVAPLVWSTYLELPLVLVVGCGIALSVMFSDRDVLWTGMRPRWNWVYVLLATWSGLRLVAAAAASAGPEELASTRNFYGVLRVVETDVENRNLAARRMVHGRIVHGMQYLDPAKRHIPTSYYGTQSGVGLLLNQSVQTPNRHVGMVGLGVGTLAAYGRPGDQFRFYEINPDVIRLAQKHFTFLQDSQANVEMVVGDARLCLEREPPQQFDALILDAFSSDAVPAHLLTKEAFAIYVGHLAPNGVLAIHVTNRHFDLEPVILGAAQDIGWQATRIRSAVEFAGESGICDWMLLAKHLDDHLTDDLRQAAANSPRSARQPVLWTDRFNHVVGVMK